MYNLRKLVVFILTVVLCMGLIAFPAHAETTYVEHEGLEITVAMDKDQYEAGEPITATITVKNTNTDTVEIANLEQLIPEGYRLADDSKAGMQNIELRPNQTMVLEVTFVAEVEQTEAEVVTANFFDKLLNGETLGIPNLLIAVILVIAFIIFMLLT